MLLNNVFYICSGLNNGINRVDFRVLGVPHCVSTIKKSLHLAYFLLKI